MTVEELNEQFGFNETLPELIKRRKSGKVLHPIYDKHLPAAWIIQDIWGHVENENISLGKARELTTAVIEKHINKLNNK
jgi:hypothetical protein